MKIYILGVLSLFILGGACGMERRYFKDLGERAVLGNTKVGEEGNSTELLVVGDVRKGKESEKMSKRREGKTFKVVGHRARRVAVIIPDNNEECTYTYSAHTPNLTFIKKKVATFTINRCKSKKNKGANKKKNKRTKKKKKGIKGMKRKNLKEQRKTRKNGRKGRKGRKLEEKTQKGKKLRNKNKRKQERERRRNKKELKMFADQERFRKWKRKHNMQHLLKKPVAQAAIHDLWKKFFSKSPQWTKIYDEMHKKHAAHSSK